MWVNNNGSIRRVSEFFIDDSVIRFIFEDKKGEINLYLYDLDERQKTYLKLEIISVLKEDCHYLDLANIRNRYF